MEDALRIIAELEPEQLAERAAALAHEIAYWRQVIEDAAKVNDAVLAGTKAVLESTAAALALLPLLPPEQLPLVEAIVSEQRRAINALKEIGDAVGATVDLAAGRQLALQPVADVVMRRAGITPRDDSEPGT